MRFFQAVLLVLFLSFAVSGVARLPLFEDSGPAVPFALQFDSAEAALWQANRAYNEGLSAEDPALRSQALEEADKLIARSLQKRPMNPHAWSLKARLSYLKGEDEKAASSLETVIAMAPYERLDVFYRIDLAVRLWWDLSQSTRDRIQENILFARDLDRQQLEALAAVSPAHQVIISQALAP